jgi:hypothetical protein
MRLTSDVHDFVLHLGSGSLGVAFMAFLGAEKYFILVIKSALIKLSVVTKN